MINPKPNMFICESWIVFQVRSIEILNRCYNGVSRESEMVNYEKVSSAHVQGMELNKQSESDCS
jgi:hypothetical protein